MKKLKIAIVSPFPPSEGTLNEYAFHLVEQMKLKQEVGEITLITDILPEGKSYDVDPSEHCQIGVRAVWSFNDPLSIVKIWKAVRAAKPDIVLFNIHFMSFGDKKIPAALGLFTPMLCRLTGYPSVVLLHNIVESVDLASAGFSDSKLLQWIFRAIATVLTTVLLRSNLVTVTISKYVEIIERKYRAKNIALIPHGSFETPPEPDFTRLEGRARIMTFGKFGTYKKIEIMIDAIERLRDNTDQEIEVVIAGADSPNAKGYLARMEETYKDVPNLHFTGYVEEEDVPRIFGESTIVVFPYTSTTGSSGVLHQAGSYGKACVLPNIGDLKMLIEEEGYVGQYFDPTDVDSLTQAMQTLLENDELRVTQAQQNFAASASLPMEDIADWYLAHFESICTPKSESNRLPKGAPKSELAYQPA